MLRKGLTIADAAREWVQGFNAIPQSMIAKLREADPDSWHDVTTPRCGERVYVYNVPAGESSEGCIERHNAKKDLFHVRLDSGRIVKVGQDEFAVEYESYLPMWGTMWSFGNGLDSEWLDRGGLAEMCRCGFRVYEHGEWGYFFGIDGAGYDFYEAHWIPLYRARGLQWHDTEVKKEAS